MITSISARSARRFFLLLVAVLALTSCRYYYTKPGASYGAFAGDHIACVKEIGLVKGEQAYVATGPYRGCMQMRGWTRAERADPGRDWYRGIEEDGVVSINAPPPAPTTEPASAAMREHCRQIHLMRSDWRHHLDAYNACLAR